MSTKMIITIDEHLKELATQKAKDMGLSLSSLVRAALMKEVEKENLVIDKLLADTDGDRVCSIDEFQEELREMSRNA